MVKMVQDVVGATLGVLCTVLVPILKKQTSSKRGR